MWSKIKKYYPPWLDVLTFAIMFGMIVYVLFYFGRLPDEIPIHFNMVGEADGWGSKGMLFGLVLLNFHAVILCFVLNYFLIIRSADTVDSISPIIIPFIKKDRLTTAQVYIVKQHSARMLALVNFMMSILFGMIYYNIIQNGLGNQSGMGSGIGIMVLLLLVPIIYFTRRIYQEVKYSQAHK